MHFMITDQDVENSIQELPKEWCILVYEEMDQGNEQGNGEGDMQDNQSQDSDKEDEDGDDGSSKDDS